MISLCSETLKLAEKKPNFSQWVRAQLIKANEVKKMNENMNKRDYACTQCGEVLTTHHNLNYVIHESKRLGELRNTQCSGHFMEVVE